MKTTIMTPRGVPHEDMAREEQLHSLLDGRARWPDGRPREIGIPLYERMRARDLLMKRNDYGADTPIGHRCSNVVEMLHVLGDDKANKAAVIKNIERTAREIQELDFMA